MNDQNKPEMKDDMIITRILNIPIEKVWEAWIDPKKVVKWWGPKYYTSPSAKVDLKVGGKFTFSMKEPTEQGGRIFYSTGEYQKIIPNESLEFSIYLSDKDGNKIDPKTIGMPDDFPTEMNVKVNFLKIKDDMTEIIFRENDWVIGDQYVYALAGWHQQFDKMGERI